MHHGRNVFPDRVASVSLVPKFSVFRRTPDARTNFRKPGFRGISPDPFIAAMVSIGRARSELVLLNDTRRWAGIGTRTPWSRGLRVFQVPPPCNRGPDALFGSNCPLFSRPAWVSPHQNRLIADSTRLERSLYKPMKSNEKYIQMGDGKRLKCLICFGVPGRPGSAPSPMNHSIIRARNCLRCICMKMGQETLPERRRGRVLIGFNLITFL